MGKLICVDKHTNYGTSCIDARFCVNIDVTQQLPNKIALKNEEEEWFQSIQYDLLPIPYVVCKTFGHMGKDCSVKNVQRKPNPQQSRQKNKFMGKKKEKSGKQKTRCNQILQIPHRLTLKGCRLSKFLI